MRYGWASESYMPPFPLDIMIKWWLNYISTRRIYPLEHFQRKYEVDEIHYTDEVRYLTHIELCPA